MTQPGLFAISASEISTPGLDFWCPNFISGLSPRGQVGAPCRGLSAAREGRGANDPDAPVSQEGPDSCIQQEMN